MADIIGGVKITGFISPTDTLDTYPVIDPIYGIDGLRSVSGSTEKNAISDARRREGMVVYQQSNGVYYQLLASPWTGSESDWEVFNSGGDQLWASGTGVNSIVRVNSGNVAEGENSHAEGTNTTASSPYSRAEGSGTTANGSASHAEGRNTNAGWFGLGITKIDGNNVIISDDIDYSEFFVDG
jgi:hypothetical protein